MPISLFQIINLLIILVVLVFLSRYVWSILFDKNYQPAEWQHALKKGTVPQKLRKAEKAYADKVRFFNWWFQAERIRKDKIPGDFAELGVYKGESAAILHLMAPERKLHLYDTFDGFSARDLEMEMGEAASYTTSNFADTNMEKVRNTINGNENIIFHPGYFPDTTLGLEKELYAFVNMDADLFNPTAAGLEYFYGRLSPGGVIIIHDYTNKWEGIQRAVDEFVAGIPESLIAVPDMDGTVMIVKCAF